MSIIIKGNKPHQRIDVSNYDGSVWADPYYAIVVNGNGVATPLPIAVNDNQTEALVWLRRWKAKNSSHTIKETLLASLKKARAANEPIGRYHEMLGYQGIS